jgi:hypothetical protein
MARLSVAATCLLLVAYFGLCTSASETASEVRSAAPTLTDLWNGKATWVKNADNIGSDFNFHYISILPRDRELCAFYIHNYTAVDGKFKQSIGRARGTDGVHWTSDGMVLNVSRAAKATDEIPPAWDDRIASYPGIWKDGDTWYLVYEGAAENIPFSPGDIGLATSTDGRTFKKSPDNPILRHNTNDWERVNIGAPSLYKENGVWYLFYHGYDGNVCQIGVASGPSLTKLTKSTANPILPVTAGTSAWDTGTIGKRSSIVKEGAYYYLAFEGSTPQPYALAKWSSGLARSANLTSGWVIFLGNPMIPQTPGGMGNDGPELLRLNDTWYLYVRTPGKDMAERFRLETRREKQ